MASYQLAAKLQLSVREAFYVLREPVLQALFLDILARIVILVLCFHRQFTCGLAVRVLDRAGRWRGPL